MLRLVLRIGDERVRVRSAAGLNRGHLLRVFHVADVEDADAAESLGADGRLHALEAAIEPAARLLDRHEQQVAVDRHVALSAGADHRREQPRPPRILDVVGVEAVVVADDRVGALEGEVGVGESTTRAAAALGGVALFGAAGGAFSAGGVAGWRLRQGRPRRPAPLDRRSPSGFGRFASSSMLRAATPASRNPAFRPTRGSAGS